MKKITKILFTILLMLCACAFTSCFYGESSGLDFELNSSKNSYSVIGIGVCSDRYISIPNEYKGLPVTAIADHAFEGLNIIGVKFSDNIEVIGNYAFSNCANLKTLEFSNAGNLKTIGNYAFYFPSFWLWDVKIPEGVKTIGDHAFDLAWPINLSIPNSLEDVGIGAFVGMNGAQGSYKAYYFDFLTPYQTYGGAVYLGNDTNPYLLLCSLQNKNALRCQINSKTKIIGAGAFYNCKNLDNLTIPFFVHSIGEQAFNGCSSLKTIVIPENVIKIGAAAFYKCDSLSIYCYANSKLSEWHTDWNYSNCPVVWGYKGK